MRCHRRSVRYSLAVLLLLGGCMVTADIEPVLDDALVERLPLTVGVYYSPEFRAYVYEKDSFAAWGTYFDYPVGEPSVALFDQILEELFENVEAVEAPPAQGTAAPDVSGVLEPRIAFFSAAVVPGLDPSNPGLLPRYNATIGYEVSLYAVDGTKFGSWFVDGVAELRGLGGTFLWANTGEVTELAMRDAAAELLAGFREQRAVKSWLQSLGLEAKALGRRSR